MKPQNFPLRKILNGSEELYTQTNGVSEKFTLNSAKEFLISPDEKAYRIEPSSVELTSIPNEYMEWEKTNKSNFYQSIEIESVDRQETIAQINYDVTGILLTVAPSNPINVGDTVIISGSTNPTNNGEWKILEVSPSGGQIIVEETNERKLISEQVSSATLHWKERKIAELDWVQAQLEDGTLIWEAYNYNTLEDINGYWVAMKPNFETGQYEYISHLKMTENFWDYWYNYTVKVDGEPNSVIFTTLTNGTGDSQNVGSANFKLSIINNELVIEETIYDLEKTWTELYLELTNDDFLILSNYTNPLYNSDNDWNGMMKGNEMGWYWVYTGYYFVGYNMLNGETQFVDISESFPNVKNVKFDEDKGVSNAIFSITNVMSHSKYGLLIVFDSNPSIENSFSALWSPNFTNVEYATILDFYYEDYNFGGIYKNFPDGSVRTTSNSTYSINNDYLITAESYYGNLGFNFFRKKLDDTNAKAEFFTLPYYFNGAYEYIYTWEREDSFIVSYPTSIGRLKFYNLNNNFFIWRNDSNLPKLVETPLMYPNMVEDTKITHWDIIWNYNNIISMTCNFKNKTF
jgi:hypothetical protein